MYNLHSSIKQLEVQAAGGKIPRSKLARNTKTKTATPKAKDLPRKKVKLSKNDLRKSMKARTTWWNSLTHNEQKSYLKEHPNSELKLKQSVAPKLLDKDSGAKKAKKDSKKDQQPKSDKKTAKEKAQELLPITDNEKTTKLFSVNEEAVNSVPEQEQQKINQQIVNALTDNSDNDDNDIDEDVKNNNIKDKPDEDDTDDSEAEESSEASELDLNEKIDKQLHPRQKLGFIKAARILVSKNASKEDKAKAMQSMTHLSALTTLTKIAGAASLAALTYHFGSSAGAQCATYFALHHGNTLVNDSSASLFLKRWAHKRFSGDEMANDNNDNFDKLLGIFEHKASKHSHRHHHKKH